MLQRLSEGDREAVKAQLGRHAPGAGRRPAWQEALTSVDRRLAPGAWRIKVARESVALLALVLAAAYTFASPR